MYLPSGKVSGLMNPSSKIFYKNIGNKTKYLSPLNNYAFHKNDAYIFFFTDQFPKWKLKANDNIHIASLR